MSVMILSCGSIFLISRGLRGESYSTIRHMIHMRPVKSLREKVAAASQEPLDKNSNALSDEVGKEMWKFPACE